MYLVVRPPVACLVPHAFLGWTAGVGLAPVLLGQAGFRADAPVAPGGRPSRLHVAGEH